MLPTDGRSAGDRDLPGSAGSIEKVHVEARPRERKFRVSLGRYQENSWMYQLAKDGGTYYLPIRVSDGAHKRYELDFSEALFTRLEKDKSIAVRFEDLIPQLNSTKNVERVNPDTGVKTSKAGHLWFAQELRDRIRQAINTICDVSDNAPSGELESSGEREDGQAQPLGWSASPGSTFELDLSRAPTPGVSPAEIPKIEDTNKGPKSPDSPTTQDAAIWKRIPEALHYATGATWEAELEENRITQLFYSPVYEPVWEPTNEELAANEDLDAPNMEAPDHSHDYSYFDGKKMVYQCFYDAGPRSPNI